MMVKRIVFSVVLVSALLLVTSPHATAQGPSPEMRITHVDASEFPRVHVRVAPLLEDAADASNLKKDSFVIYEDGVRVDSTKEVTDVFGAQVAVFLDASWNMALGCKEDEQPVTGNTREKLSEEAIRVIDYLVIPNRNHLSDNPWFSPNRERDWLMLVAPTPGASEQIQRKVEWGQDSYTDIHNGAADFPFCEQYGVETALYEMLEKSMDYMNSIPGYEYQPKFLVVISDGEDNKSISGAHEKVIEQAEDLNVTILSIKLGSRGDDADRTRLRALATETGGAYAEYEGPDSLNQLYDLIRSRRIQYEIAYRSNVKRADEHKLQVGVLWNGNEIESSRVSLPTVIPPEVSIVTPVPFDEPIELEDGWEHDIITKTYIIEGVGSFPRVGDEPFILDSVEGLEPGTEYSLIVEVTDERGLTGRSDPASFETPRSNTVIIVGVLLLILGLVLGLILLVPRLERRGAGQTVDEEEDQPDEVPPQPPPKEPAQTEVYEPPMADLILKRNDGTKKTISIEADEVYLGREQEPPNIAFSDDTVSREHARIVKDRDNDFWIYHLSKTNKTYVEGTAVPPDGLALKDGDEIQMGRVRLIFRVRAGEAKDRTQNNETKERETEVYPGNGDEEETLLDEG